MKSFYSLMLICFISVATAAAEDTKSQPNILWITCEDISPDLGSYGDKLVKSPHLDRLAGQGCTYTRAFATSPVCSSSRSAIITGIYATTLGTHHHRSMVPLPEDVRCFTAYLRDAGYYCTNNDKNDYNFEIPADAWDANGNEPTGAIAPAPISHFLQL